MRLRRCSGAPVDSRPAIDWERPFLSACLFVADGFRNSGSSCDTVSWRTRFSAALHCEHSFAPGRAACPQIEHFAVRRSGAKREKAISTIGRTRQATTEGL
ncbi:MAG: hypothetical protein ABI886_12860 [Betaproteobacteria bacterium]